MTPAVKAARGTKRKCQSESCGLHFYDLNRDAIVCPNCQSGFVVPPVYVPQQRLPRPMSRSPHYFPAVAVVTPDDVPEDVTEELVAVEETEETVEADITPEPILEVDHDDDPLEIAVEGSDNDNEKKDE